jgi:hypothetical protein
MTTNTETLPHRLRAFPGGELGNEAADEIERMAKEVYQHKAAAFTWEQKYRSVAAYGSLGWTIETVSQWLETQGLCAVSKADAERVERCKSGCVLQKYARHTDECLVHRRTTGLRMAAEHGFVLPCICGFKSALEQKQ